MNFRPRYRLSRFILGLFAIGAVAALVPVALTVTQFADERALLDELARTGQVHRRLAALGQAFESPSLVEPGFDAARERTLDLIGAELDGLRDLLIDGLPAGGSALRSVAAATRALAEWRGLPGARRSESLDQQYRSVTRLMTLEALAAAALQVDQAQRELFAHQALEVNAALVALLVLILVLGLIAAVIVVDVMRPLRRWAEGLTRNSAQASMAPLVPEHVIEFKVLGDALEARRAQLIVTSARLEEANSELAQIIHSLSHDLRSPLVTVAGFTGVVRKELVAADGSDVAQALDDIAEAIRTMEQLLTRVLDWARAGRVSLRAQPIPVAGLAQAAMRSLAGSIDATGAVVSLAGEDLTLWGDPVALGSVIQNLLMNAIEHGAAPGQAPRVAIRAYDRGPTQSIEVRDEGPGIDAAMRARILEPFERAGHSRGPGLGLTIARRYVERHGGTIEFGSGPAGAGTVVRVVLPARGAPGAVPPQEAGTGSSIH